MVSISRGTTSWLRTISFACLFVVVCAATGWNQAHSAGLGNQWVRDNPFTILGWNIGNEHGQQFEGLFRGAGLNTQSWPDKTVGGPIHYWREWLELDALTQSQIAFHRYFHGNKTTAWIITDEAPTSQYASIRQVMDELRRLDPGKPVYSSLHWSFTNPLESEANERIPVRDILQPDILFNPNFPFKEDGVDRFYNHAVEGGTLAHVMKLREEGLAANKPYFITLQGFKYSDANPSIAYRLPNETELRALTYAYLSGGTKGIAWFQYEANQLDVGLISNSGVPSPVYPIAAEINAEVKVLGNTLRLLDSTDVRIVLGKYRDGSSNVVNNPMPQGMTGWSAGAGGNAGLVSITPTSPVLPASSQRSADLLTGLFWDNSNQPYFMLTNLMHGQNLREADTQATFELEFRSSINRIYRLDPQTGAIEAIDLTDHKYVFDYAGGHGQLFNYTGDFLNPTGPGISPFFSLGYGYVDNSRMWDTSETGALNTSTIQGDFTFAADVGHTSGSGLFSTGGPTFVSRTLDSSTVADYSATGSTLEVTVDGEYTGTPLAGYRTQLEISSISVWGVDSSSGDRPNSGMGPIRWKEVTPGNEGVSDFQDLPTCSSVAPACDNFGVLGAADHYGQLVWDPNDSLGTPGTVADTRTFQLELGATISANYLGVDGVEILGHVNYVPACDFNLDNLCKVADIRVMMNQGDLVTGVSVVAGNAFDLNSDNNINEADITEWLVLTGTHNGYGSPMLRGDTDGLSNVFPASRTVDITDFQNFLTGFTSSCVTWKCGNFNGDNDVDITDFSTHFLPSFTMTGGGTYGSAQSTPEPSALLLLGSGGLLLAFVLCRRR